MKNIIRSFLIFCTAIMLLMSSVFADNSIYKENPEKLSEDWNYRKFEYVIDAYDVNIKVNENNTLDVTEKIIAYFREPMHGIVRTIPAFEHIEKDEDSQIRRLKLENVIVNEDFEINKVNGNYEISIGSNIEKITGEKEYIIKYTYDLGKDKIKDADEFYFDIIGDKWDTCIGNVTFTIEMPKDFSSYNISFHQFTSLEVEELSYEINGKIIHGKLNDSLSGSSGLTIQIELPDGYFNGRNIKADINFNFACIISLICFSITFLIWIIKYKGFTKVKTETLEVQSLNGHNSSEIKISHKIGISNILSFCLFFVSTIVFVYSFIAEYTNNNGYKFLFLGTSLGYFLLLSFLVFCVIFFVIIGIKLILENSQNSGKYKKIMIFSGIIIIIFSICLVLQAIYYFNHLLYYGEIYFSTPGRVGRPIGHSIYLKDLPILLVMLSQSNYMIAGLLGIGCSIATLVLFILIKQKNKNPYKGIFR